VSIVHANALSVPLHAATVVFLYLLPQGNARLADKLEAELRPDARLVTHMFRMPPAWAARLADTCAVGSCRRGGVDTSAFTKLYLYRPGAPCAVPGAENGGGNAVATQTAAAEEQAGGV
jgi:hypothetical protein